MPGGGSWTDILGATSNTFTTAPLTMADSGRQYRAVATNSVDSANSNVVTITVLPTAVTGVTLDRQTMGLAVGATGSLVATIQPPNATDQSVTWFSDNTNAATVSGSGLSATVTARALGSAKITVTTNDGPFTDACEVTVGLAPTITAHPQPRLASINQSVSFMAAASGTPALTYRWEKSTNGGSTWTDTGATTPEWRKFQKIWARPAIIYSSRSAGVEE
jgi:hypothetical protein